MTARFFLAPPPSLSLSNLSGIILLVFKYTHINTHTLSVLPIFVLFQKAPSLC